MTPDPREEALRSSGRPNPSPKKRLKKGSSNSGERRRVTIRSDTMLTTAGEASRTTGAKE